MSKILLLSDSHLFSAEKLPTSLIHHAKQCELIVHCGDIVAFEIIHVLAFLKPIEYVLGNCDLSVNFPQAKRKRTFDFHGTKIGVVHGVGASGDPNLLRTEFEKQQVDVVMSGHTHRKFNKRIEGVHFINPGAITDARDGSCSYALVDIEDGEVRVKFVEEASFGG